MSTAPNQRANPRERLMVDLSQNLVTNGERKPVRCLAIDASRNGLGIVAFEALIAETEVILVLKERGVTLKVMWCKADAIRNVYHIGLGSNDLSLNLPKLLETNGLLRAGQKPKPAEEASPEPTELTFAMLREALATARTTDASVFRDGALKKLGTQYNAYPIRVNNLSVCVLLPKDLKPADAGKLDDEAAQARRIMIFKTLRAGALELIWPRTTP